jgi:hypothetical protein
MTRADMPLRYPMIDKELSRELSDAKSRGVPWHALAKACLRALNTRVTGREARSALMREIAEVSGYTPSYIVRAITARKNAEHVAAAQEIELQRILDLPLMSVELLTRLCRQDPKIRPQELIQRIHEERIPVSKLLRMRRAQVTENAALLEDSFRNASMEREIAVALTKCLDQLIEIGQHDASSDTWINWNDSAGYYKPDFVIEVYRNGNVASIAVNCYSVPEGRNLEHGRTTEAALSKMSSQVALQATFFDAYVIVLEARLTSSTFLAALYRMLSDLELQSVAIARWHMTESRIEIVRRPLGPPMPDRRRLRLRRRAQQD